MSHYNWGSVPAQKVTDRLSRKLIYGEKVMLAQIFLKKGCIIPAHSHKSEQMTYILRGSLRLRLPEKEVTLDEDEVLLIPSLVEHSAVALEDTLNLDIFSPVREDWLSAKDKYLRKSKQRE